jgi:hypothetical protein
MIAGLLSGITFMGLSELPPVEWSTTLGEHSLSRSNRANAAHFGAEAGTNWYQLHGSASDRELPKQRDVVLRGLADAR